MLFFKPVFFEHGYFTGLFCAINRMTEECKSPPELGNSSTNRPKLPVSRYPAYVFTAGYGVLKNIACLKIHFPYPFESCQMDKTFQ
jgi:hypothetical protein